MRSQVILLASAALTLFASAAEAASRSQSWAAQGRFGHGYTASRTATWGEGSLTRQGQRTFNNGMSQSGWRTIHRTDDGYTRSRGASGSGGRGIAGTKDVSFGPDSVTVDRSGSTASGGAWTRSRTWPRGD
ncbi:MAG: hypothetical protein U1C74_26825 [Phenylobacterium sp.]|nr:hypothetical protein [Phenylobacterium sp.]